MNFKDILIVFEYLNAYYKRLKTKTKNLLKTRILKYLGKTKVTKITLLSYRIL